jgi:hypothetical protein
MTEYDWYTFFDHCHCDHPTRSGQACRIAPQWVERSTGQRLCYVHATMVFARLKAANGVDPEIVHAR